jgi:two-component system NtrC family response regulator
LNKILIIDDEEKLRTLLAKIISLEGFEVIQSGDFKSAVKKLEQYDVDVVICDVKLPDGNGVELSKSIKEKYPAIEIILLTAYGNIPDSVQAIKNGAFDYITKGDDNNKIIPLIYKATEKVMLAKRVLQLEKQLGNKYSFDSIIGKSKTIKHAIDDAKKVCITDATVLLTGETGTGKEVFAQASHKEGAFTGAIKDTKGIFEEANNGTVFLDEIGEMPLDLQAKLLRVLETGEFLKVGDSKSTKINVRIIAATNRDLQNEIEAGNFREDLFYRIAVFKIALPPLRQRVIDIEELATSFLLKSSNKTNKKIYAISDAYLEALKQHSWKGNIRELKNVIERSVILEDSKELKIDSLPLELKIDTPDNSRPSSAKTLSAFDLASAEKIHIQKVMNYTNGNKTETARLLNIALTTLYRKLDQLNIS